MATLVWRSISLFFSSSSGSELEKKRGYLVVGGATAGGHAHSTT